MKLFPIILLIAFLSEGSAGASTPNLEEEKFLCSGVQAFQLRKQVLQLPNDKTKHCALSCFLTWRCGPLDAWELGALKEVWDLFGPGQAEWSDLEADGRGIFFGVRVGIGRKADRQCINLCKSIYPGG
ncbi:MAG: hypothetical protein A2X86_16900 [Bdellovibrionales bacterium GWA2_49_15]|nr:MAG: hypothetical protein A2X86_16900 [Bdellovibrionales bacterium GWA2_49_15]HAZ12446.1 hypothetical protein [Bdellovibrionales bacterium]